MKTSTHTLPLDSSREATFDFLSKIENLLKWATMFCLELKKDSQGQHKVVTPDGEIFFRIEADRRTGTIDMYGGPTESQMAYWPARVVERPVHGNLLFSRPCSIRACPTRSLRASARAFSRNSRISSGMLAAN